MNIKICNICKIEKPIKEFSKNSISKDGINYSCKQCNRIRSSKWILDHPERVKERSKQYHETHKEEQRKLLYGMGFGEYDRLLKTQKGRCYICGQERSLYIDHCHKTNKVRGLLCPRCNHLIGVIETNFGLLDTAIEYIILNGY